MIWFILLAVVFIALVLTYYSWHIFCMLPPVKYRKVIAGIITVMLLLSVAIHFVMFGVLINMGLFFIVYDICNIVFKYWNVTNSRWSKLRYKEWIAIGLSLLLSGYGIYNVRDIQITDYKVTVEKEVANKTIIAASDMHISTVVSTKELDYFKEVVFTTKPEYVFLVGDIYDESTNKKDTLYSIKIFKEIASTTKVYYVEGNHDRGYEKIGPLEKYDVINQLTQAGIKVLQDEVVQDNGINIIGRKDARIKDRKNMKSLLKECNLALPIIVLDHQPKELKSNSELGVDMQISGHTHAGQLFPTGQVSEILGINEMNYGIRKIDQFHCVVSSGMGMWGFPMRTSEHSEIVKIELQQRR